MSKHVKHAKHFHWDQEDKIVNELAGQPGAITITTNKGSRGTNFKLADDSKAHGYDVMAEERGGSPDAAAGLVMVYRMPAAAPMSFNGSAALPCYSQLQWRTPSGTYVPVIDDTTLCLIVSLNTMSNAMACWTTLSSSTIHWSDTALCLPSWILKLLPIELLKCEL